MINLLRFILRYQTLLLFIILEIIAFALITNNSNYQKTKVAIAITDIKGSVYEKITAIEKYFYLKSENEKLSKENAELQNKLQAYENTDTIKYRENTDSVRKITYKYTLAKVVSNSTNKQQNFILINAGSLHGIRPDMGVITNNGIVGMIVRVSKNYSLAISVLNNGFNKFSGKLKKTGEYGTISWDGISADKVKLYDISQQVNIKIGDTVVTNQYSGAFPEGVIIGTISKFKAKDGNFYDIDVKLGQDMRKLNYVYIIDFAEREEREKLMNND